MKVQAYDYVTHELVAGSVTDASGYFKLEVVENQNGYRVKPYLYGWAWCPAYYDTATEAINIKFNGINPTKD